MKTAACRSDRFPGKTHAFFSSPDRLWSVARSPPGAGCGPLRHQVPLGVVVYILARQAPSDATNCASSKDRGIPATNTARGPIAGAAAPAP